MKTCVIGQVACTGVPYSPPINFCRVIVSWAGARGLPLLAILQHFRERFQEAPCRPFLELRILGLPPLLDHVRRQARPDDPAFVGLQDQRVRPVWRQFRVPEPFNPLRLGLLVLAQARDGRRNRFVEARDSPKRELAVQQAVPGPLPRMQQAGPAGS